MARKDNYGEMKDDYKRVIAEIDADIKKKAGLATPGGTKPGGVGSLVSGATKFIAGGLGAVPTAVGKAVEQTPTGIGRAIGAVPVNPPDYGSNPSLKLMGEGADEISSAARGIGTAARSGVMSALNLKEAPAPVQTPTPVAPTLQQPAPPKQGVAPAAPAASGMDAVMKEIKATRTEPFGIGGAAPEKPAESAGYVENATTGERINVPKAKPAAEGSGINSLISQLESDYRNAPTRKLKLGIGNLLVEAEKSRTSLAQTHLTKTENAKERGDALRERNDLLKQRIDDARAAGQDTRALKKEQSKINTLKAKSKKLKDPITGEEQLDYTEPLMKMALSSPDEIPEGFRAEADEILATYNSPEFSAYVDRWAINPKSGKAGGKVTEADKKSLFKIYYSKMSGKSGE